MKSYNLKGNNISRGKIIAIYLNVFTLITSSLLIDSPFLNLLLSIVFAILSFSAYFTYKGSFKRIEIDKNQINLYKEPNEIHTSLRKDQYTYSVHFSTIKLFRKNGADNIILKKKSWDKELIDTILFFGSLESGSNEQIDETLEKISDASDNIHLFSWLLKFFIK
ncbi:hypothetical protein [Reichenbachiella versicolor]|uniref:hypothetical protein n=1 Tax=Reichenbachiella versicolor TaxID=1821036 RepID=UPI000D6E68AD|nr:hypothetical protein [Reichenbachiella versicolor]